MFVAIRPWLLRSRRHGGLLLVVMVVAAVLAVVAGATLTIVLQAPTSELRSTLRSIPASARTLEIAASGDPASQDSAFRGLVVHAFGSAPVRVTTTVRGDTSEWAVAADPARITADDLTGLDAGFRELPEAAAERFAADGGTTTRHASTVRDEARVLVSAVAAVRAAAPVPLSIIVIAGAVALVLTGRLLIEGRAVEDRLLRARGASDLRLLSTAALEALVSGGIGAAAGSVIGTLVAADRWHVDGAGTLGIVLAAATSVTVVAVAAVTGAAVRRDRTAASPTTRGAAVRIGAGLLFLDVLAAVAVWRYRTPGNATGGDPLAVVAPAVLLTALGVTGALALVPLLAFLARTSERGRGLVRPVGLRLASRDGRRLFVPAALLVLAVASGALSATFDASTRGFLRDSGRIEHGAALEADVGGPLPVDGPADLLPVGVRDRQAVRRGIRPVLRLSGTTGDATQAGGGVDVVGVDAPALSAMLPVAARTFDVRRAGQGLRRAQPGLALGAGGTGTRRFALVVRTTASAATDDARVEMVAWVVDAVGDVAPVTTTAGTLSTDHRPTDQTLHGTLPSGGPWRLAALDVRLRSDADLSDVAVDVRSIAVDGTAIALPARRWTAADGAYDASGLRTAGSAAGDVPSGALGVRATRIGVTAQPGSAVSIRLMPGAQRVVPVLASSSTGTAVGDTVAVGGAWAGFKARVVGIAATVPGTDGGPAYLADLPALDQAVLAASQRPQRIRAVWAADADTRAFLARTVPDATITAPSTGLEARFARLVALALLAGTAAALFCAVLILAATAAAVARDRRDEALGLRLVGVTASQQARLRAIGPAVTGAVGLGVGIVAGVAAAALVGGAAVRASAPRAPGGLGVPLVATGWVVLVVVSVVVLAVAVVTVAHAAAVRRAAARTGREAR